ncbi:MAG: AMP-binding protein [Clostridiales Family XIII bacterium]|jgi:long-subunit acyl-CoA synthetase (AMP-forming)|nr:AMP-binding protein [Clostridiales Family XIII bacterium]
MAYKQPIPADEYAKITERDTKWAQEMYDFLRSNPDKYMKYNDKAGEMNEIRPIVNIKQMFETSVAKWGERPAFWEKPSHKEPYAKYTYDDAYARVSSIGTALMARGLAGANISVIGDNSYAWSTAYLAACCGTGVVVPLDKELQKGEIENLLITAGAEAIFYPKKFAPMMQEIRDGGKTQISLWVRQDAQPDGLDPAETSVDTLISEGEALLAGGDRSFADAQIDAERLGILIFTSGTTGTPKGVMLSHKNIAAECMIPTTVIGIGPDDIFFSFLPLHHTYEATCGFLIPLTQGASIAYCEGLRYIVDNLAEAHPTLFLGVPLIFENLYKKIWQNVRKEGKEKLLLRVLSLNKVTKKIGLDLGNIFFKQIRALFGGNMRLIICGGAAIDPAVIDGIQAFGVGAVQGYGLTESSPICALNPIAGGKSDSAGYIVPGFKARIEDPDPETRIGEIVIGGDAVMMGYYGDEAATAEVMEDGWFHSGDYGYIDEDNFVFITGRKKNVIITKTGKNVFPEELEYFLGRSNVLGEMMVWETISEKNDDTVIALTVKIDPEGVKDVLGEDHTQEQVDGLVHAEVDKVNAELPIFKRIRKIYLRDDDFIVTTSKKIKRFEEANKTGREL